VRGNDPEIQHRDFLSTGCVVVGRFWLRNGGKGECMHTDFERGQASEQAQIAWCSFGASAGVFTVGFIDLAFPFFPARRLAG